MSIYTRRSFIRRSAGAAVGVTAVGSRGLEALAKPGHAAAASPLLSARPGGLASIKTLTKWNDYLAGLGARHTGGESETQLVADLKSAMRGLGCNVSLKQQAFTGWEANDFALSVTPPGGSAQKLDVSYYYPYSGATTKAGIVGELAYANKGSAADFQAGSFAGKIAVIDVSPFSIPVGVAFNAWDDIYADDVDISEPYDRSWIASGPSLAAAVAAGAIGAIIILPQAPDDALGQYQPFGRPPQGIPALNVNAQVGVRIRDLAQAGGSSANLVLTAKQKPGKTKSLLATLPGAGDEVVVVNTHNDGTNLIEENGMLAMVSLAQRLAAMPKSKRPATVAFYFATGHFQHEVESSEAYVTDYPDLFARTKAGLTIEHLGCPEYVDDHFGSFGPTGKPEISGLFASNQTLANLARPTILANGVTRCTVIEPTPQFFGEGGALHEAGIPMLSYIAGPDYLLAERSKKVQLKRFDVTRMATETKAFARLLDQLMATPKTS